ncbi:unnamed protein product [Durusdinium trenchii]|uniref:Lysine decarboxylase family protein n=1 Tax=Durusdinium trenchii TaxID=1381693 RepID=A0ABP0STN9_9DINO
MSKRSLEEGGTTVGQGPRPPKAYKNNDFLNSTEARLIRIMCELEEPKDRLRTEAVDNIVMFFGSARAKPKDQYEAAVKEAEAKVAANPGDAKLQSALTRLKKQEFLVGMFDVVRETCRLLTLWTQNRAKQGLPEYHVGTGGGPGMMAAANEGAAQAKGKSIGFGISVPFEDGLNPYVTESLGFEFHYFFTRKFWMAFKCMGLVVAPGGFGTCDELFELLTLMQTGKIKRQLPIVLIGKKFWKDCIQWDAFVHYGMISDWDSQQLRFADTAEDERGRFGRVGGGVDRRGELGSRIVVSRKKLGQRRRRVPSLELLRRDGLQADLLLLTQIAGGRADRRWLRKLHVLEEARQREVLPDVQLVNVVMAQAIWHLALPLLRHLEIATPRALRPSAVSLGTAAARCDRASKWRHSLRLWSHAAETTLPRSQTTANSVLSALARGAHWTRSLVLLTSSSADAMRTDLITMGSLLSSRIWRFSTASLDWMGLRGLRPHLGIYQAILRDKVNRWPDRWHGALTVLATARSSALQLDEVLVSTALRARRHAVDVPLTLRRRGLRCDAVAVGSAVRGFAEARRWRCALHWADRADLKDVTAVVGSGVTWTQALAIRTRSAERACDALLDERVARACAAADAWHHAWRLRNALLAPWTLALVALASSRVEPVALLCARSWQWRTSLALGGVAGATPGQWQRIVQDLPSAGALASLATARRWREAFQVFKRQRNSPSRTAGRANWELEVLVWNAGIVGNKYWESSLLILRDMEVALVRKDLVSMSSSRSADGSWARAAQRFEAARAGGLRLHPFSLTHLAQSAQSRSAASWAMVLSVVDLASSLGVSQDDAASNAAISACEATSAWATAAVKCCEMTRRRLATVITFNSCIAVASLAAWGTWRFCLALLLRRGRLGVAPVDASDAGLGGTFACLVRTSRWQRAVAAAELNPLQLDPIQCQDLLRLAPQLLPGRILTALRHHVLASRPS